MANRKGLGKGRGSGWKNLARDDSNRHSLSARGIKSAQKIEGDLKARIKALSKFNAPKFKEEKAMLQKQLKDIEQSQKNKIGVMDIKSIETQARNLIGGMHIPHTQKISILYYYIFQDANYHELNTRLTKNGNFGEFEVHHYELGDVYVPKNYGTDYATKKFKDYQKAGGRTWQL